MSSAEMAQTIFKAQGNPPWGFNVALSEDVIPNPETGDPMTIYYLLFKNSEYQKVAQGNRQQFVDIARWLRDCHEAMSGVGLKVLVQPIFDGYDGLTPDQAKYKTQEIRKKK
jgi:hypothetical protein